VQERDFDVVVFGSTGITGRQVAAYLDEQGARWAAAARDPRKSEQVLGEVGVSAPETIVADVADPSSLAAMAARTRVVLNLVGPYTRYGRPVIEACVAGGSHYADLTGETPFVRTIIDDLDARAREAGVKVIPTCGFEALPADLAVLLAAETARERWGEALMEADLEATVSGGPGGLPRPSDILSGGTLQSVAAAVSFEGTASVSDSAALITDPVRAEQVRRRSPLKLRPRRGRHGAVVAPMAPAAFINPPVIQRTAALIAAEGDGAEPFRYREGVALRGNAATLPLRFAGAGVMAGTQSALNGLDHVPMAMRRRLGRGLSKVLPSSGFGPKGERLETWRWRMSVEARTAGGHVVEVEVDADGHPGYLTTARMLGEAGLMLAEPGLTPDRAGCLTPATALGTGAIDRFERARMRFSVSG
jgi:short subunit dehydrogenase-like uncharacterized protein